MFFWVLVKIAESAKTFKFVRFSNNFQIIFINSKKKKILPFTLNLKASTRPAKLLASKLSAQ
jgi:hypothetical protein